MAQSVSTALPNLNTVWFYTSFKNLNRIAGIQAISSLAEKKTVCIQLLLLFRNICLFLFCFVLYLSLFKIMYHTPLVKYQRSLILHPLPQESRFTFSVLFLVTVIISAVLLHSLKLSSWYRIDFLSHGFVTKWSHILQYICSSNNSW